MSRILGILNFRTSDVRRLRGRLAQLARVRRFHPAKNFGFVAQLVRAFRSHRKGQRFESSRTHPKILAGQVGKVRGSNPLKPTQKFWRGKSERSEVRIPSNPPKNFGGASRRGRWFESSNAHNYLTRQDLVHFKLRRQIK